MADKIDGKIQYVIFAVGSTKGQNHMIEKKND